MGKPRRMHWWVGREDTACGVFRTVFITRDRAKVTCPKCRREMRLEKPLCDVVEGPTNV